MDSFLHQTALSLIESMDWKQLSNATLVLPSHRAGLVLKDEILRLQKSRNAQAIWAPRVRTLTQLQDELSPLYAEDELMTIVRLYRHYCRLNRADQDLMPLDQFYLWGKQMIADFTNIDASMPVEEVPNFFDNTIAAHELEQWKLDSETEERLRALMNGEPAPVEHGTVRARYEVLWRDLYTLYQSLNAEMSAEQKGYAGMRQRAVLSHWEEESIQHQIAGRQFVFVGFNYLLPVERDLMMRLRDQGQARFYWDYVPDFQTNRKAFSFTQLNSALLGSEPMERAAQREPKQVTVLSCVSMESQAQLVHRWLKDNYTAKGQKIGIVLCDETMLEPVIYALPEIRLPGEETPEPINITKGFPLRNTVIYARVMAWLHDKSLGEAGSTVEPEILSRLEEAVFPVSAQDEEKVPVSTEQSYGMKWQELLILESEYQVRKVINQVRKILSEGLGDIPFTLKLLRLLMRRTLEAVTMPFHGEPVTDIQVMGVLETRLLDFDKLLILNVEEGILPQKQQDISFIPFYLRKTYHMQTSDERATVYAYNFFRLLSRSAHSILTYATAETSEGGKGMSRFILQMLYSPEFIVEKQQLNEPNELQETAYSESFTAVPSLLSSMSKDTKGMLVRSDGKPFRLSPSALNAYISCPRSFYWQYILGLRPKQKEDVLFLPNTFGSFVHYAMEYIYRTFLHCDGLHPTAVSSDEIEEIRMNESRLDEALMAAYDKMNEEEEGVYVPEHHVSENVVIKGYIRNILARDREDAKEGLQIYLLEQNRMFDLEIDGVGKILSGGKIDRLDIYGAKGSEKIRVVDYKSGSYNDKTHQDKMSALWENIADDEQKGYVRQTLLYSHAVMVNEPLKKPIEPHLFFCRRKLTDIVTTIDVEGQPVSDYAMIASQFIEAMKPKIKELLNATEFPQCAEGECPSYCPFFDLCGRHSEEF